MATIGNERHLRYILLLGEGGLLILHAILERETNMTGDSLDVLLQPHKQSLFLKMNNKQYQKLYPQTGNVDKTTWDILLLGTVILQLFETSLSVDACNNIRKLKELRNDLAHQSSFSMNKDVYDEARGKLAALLIKLSSGLDRDVHDECQNCVKRFHTDPIDVTFATERLKEISKFDEKMADELRTITGLVIDVLVKCDLIAIQDLNQLIQQRDKFYSVQVVRAKMGLRGENDHLTNLGETTIKKSFESALNRTKDEFLKLKIVVDKFLDAIKKHGGKVFHVETGCIFMKIECTSCQGLLNLLKYLESEEFKQRLLDIAIMLKEIFKCVYHITFEVTQDSLRNILDSLRKESSSQTRLIKRNRNQSRASDDAIDFEGSNDALVDDISELLEKQDHDYPEVILLIGKSGAGKSALINTIHKALTGKYFGIAKPGKGEAATATMELNRYDNCGVKTADWITNERLKKVYRKLPFIFDCAGLADENTKRLREQLEFFIGGYIPPTTSIAALEEHQNRYGIGALKMLFQKQNPEWKVTKIVFMQGCIDDIPRNLIQSLKDVLKIHNENLERKYQCDKFVLITKYDLVKDAEDSHLYGQPGDKCTTLEDLEKVEETLEKEFNYAGHRNASRMHCVCLNDNTGFDNPNIDNIALKFLKRMVEPGVPRVENQRHVLHISTRFRLFLKRVGHMMSGFLNQDIHISLPKLLIVVAILIAVLAFFYSLLSQGITSATNGTDANTSAQGNTSG